MSYQVLARKWRPQNFDQLIGQKHIIKALHHTIENQKIHHAYLFTGTRGVGKTTIARVFAKSLNCENGPTTTPCLQCASCVAIADGSYVDLLEIDAASRTRVEDTREILDNVQYAPTQGRYKIYLIDEIHMLSGHSFNALLKTLEEPPAHVIFLLATTDPQKIPMTVLSRCLQFYLKPLSSLDISLYLQQVCQGEQVEYDTAAVDMLAESAKGSVRDGLSLLDQAIAYSGGHIQLKDVLAMTGNVDDAQLYEILSALLANDGKTLMTICQAMVTQGADFSRVLSRLMNLFHQISVVQCFAQNNTEAYSDQIIHFASQFSKEDAQLCYEICLKGYDDLSIVPIAAVGFEMTLLRLLTFNLSIAKSLMLEKQMSSPAVNKKIQVPASVSTPSTLTDKNLLNNHNARQESDIQMQADKTVVVEKPPVDTQPEKRQVPITTIESIVEPAPAPASNIPAPQVVEPSTVNETSSTTPETVEAWTQTVEQLPLMGVAKSVLSHCVLINKTPELVTLGIEANYQAMLTSAARSAIEQALRQYWQQNFRLEFEVSSEVDKQTPAAYKQQLHDTALSDAKENMRKDPCLNEILTRFDGKIDENAIQLQDRNS